jgi:hypothetical protein
LTQGSDKRIFAQEIVMESQNSIPSPALHGSVGPIRGPLADAIHFWEPRRLVYNFVLTGVVVVWVVASWPHFRPAFALPTLLPMAGLALIANVCYCAAYIVDIPMLYSSNSDVWKRRRWILLLIGTLFAILLENYWIADEIYPFV